MIRVKLTHRTEYHYDREVALFPHVIRLRPAPHTRTHIESYALTVEPKKKFLNWQQDPFANWQARVVFPEPSETLVVEVNLVAHIQVYNPFDFFVEDYAAKFPFAYEAKLATELAAYLKPSEDSPDLRNFVRNFRSGAAAKNNVGAPASGPPSAIVDFLVAANGYVKSHVGYIIRMEPGVQTAAETISKKSGSCRDSAYLLVQMLRQLGLAARFVSGYLIQLKADDTSTAGQNEHKGPANDFTDLHAWAEVFIPGAGWIGLDATSGLFAAEGHIPLAATPEPESAAAIHGFTEPARSTLNFSMSVTRLSETPRVTKPYTEETWQEILELGKKIDRDLVASDMRLSIGGEPTFVSATDRESRQWNFDALGEDKYKLSEQLIERLAGIYSKGGVILRSQGKWYPGEPLPRWSLDTFWRKDGQPLWNDLSLLGFSSSQDKAPSVAQAEQLCTKIAKNLGMPADTVHAAFEDPARHLVAEAALPVEFTREIQGNSFSEIERRRLLRILDRGLGKPAGYALPLTYNRGKKTWESAITEFRRGFLCLLAGDSPMGLRLPITAIAEAFEPEYATDPFDAKRTGVEKIKARGRVRREPIATFLCVEMRQDKLWVFLPPVARLEEFAALLQEIEKAAKALGIIVHLEGYEPPRDPRLNFFRITPDPGVIEVNMFPSVSAAELIAKTQTIYDEAEKTGLTTDRYMLDGRPSATGGGNHITVGALNPEDSPFLRRADLLPSLIAYWQNHPALSYLFSGLFIGPTSQAPRIDEAREGSLYEAEIALKELRRLEDVRPWQIDRILRNILVDMTGNTHRAEISIDKLYAPGSYSGRLGLVELRAFEMPPHYRMSVVQQLMVMALLIKFWHTPYNQPLIPWGAALKDRWLLPHFLQADLQAVLKDLADSGYLFADYFFTPFHEFRFPLYGHYRFENIGVEVRQALEPWNVLGEETLSGNISRSVDSSVERLQVKLSDFDSDRYALACNGFEVPLTAIPGGYVAGVVYKAWSPPFSLHPTVPIHTPLRLCIYDMKHQKYVAGCSYHVAHPGGRSYETFPVNSYEAESRRLSRFEAQAEYPKYPPKRLPNVFYPHTLDLRLA